MSEQPEATTRPAPSIGIIGAGAMGEAILAGLLAAGHDPARLRFVETDDARAAALGAKYGVERTDTATAAGSDIVMLLVKPHVVAAVLTEVAPHVGAATLVVCFAAGVDLATLEGGLPAGTACVRVMPNTPALVGAGVFAASPGRYADAAAMATTTDLLATMGTVVEVPERLQPAVTAVSGSGPAYVFYLAEAMIEAGVHLGLPRADATTLTVGTLLGSAKLLEESGEHPGILREQVTSPGGTTAAALRVLDERAVRGALLAALEANAVRAGATG